MNNIYWKDYILKVTAEYRIGDIITCEAIFIKSPYEWIVDDLFTHPKYRMKGYARVVLTRAIEISGLPLRVMVIADGAESFWDHLISSGMNITKV